jgi:hypothetical protein
MDNMAASPRPAGWLTTLIQEARARGVDNHDIVAALEASIVFRPMTIGRDGRDRLVGLVVEDAVTLTDLFAPPDDRHASRKSA